MSIQAIRRAMRQQASSAKARVLQSFFKTGHGQYGEGDVFLGLTTPKLRILAEKYARIDFPKLRALLRSGIHEERLLALLILVSQFRAAAGTQKKRIFEFYLRHRRRVNNWDLVDSSAHHIVGAYLQGADRSLLSRLAVSRDLWERRIAIVATFHFIRQGHSGETFKIARLLLKDEQDLIHKAVGWMLREVGKHCSEKELEDFLDENAIRMPRTALRYAIERFSDTKRRKYLKIKG